MQDANDPGTGLEDLLVGYEEGREEEDDEEEEEEEENIGLEEPQSATLKKRAVKDVPAPEKSTQLFRKTFS
uniref:Uncharacterized protein n=1 Tax=Chromera velia CCMP2878 TaxID=1169474 RepID=A0A0G4F713_9ALVE|eukprot:Cvel_15567.t1-p1 / transcript=Cvel_15567.t1 / gene=Cvel_15567 / organism=Chromera_velia_CCMP2878 / gene_product=hypothetical protein / transcript_product=hypothetical protein / location=Cvel_scaffold1157:31401-36605(+) / protein_length=70 / sequence_SO=supercontig / SO=protein_coding / is_pseudo=false